MAFPFLYVYFAPVSDATSNTLPENANTVNSDGCVGTSRCMCLRADFLTPAGDKREIEAAGTKSAAC